jgi:hypothetical protein
VPSIWVGPLSGKPSLAWPQLVVGAMLLWALNPSNDYAYYTLLRWVCCATFGYLAYVASQHAKTEWAWALGIAALIYNPFAPLHLTRQLWSLINVATLVLAVASIGKIGDQPTSQP